MKDNENHERALMCIEELPNKIMEHVVHQLQYDLELSMVEDVSCLPDFQVKNYVCGSQGTYNDRSCTQQLCNNQMINDIIKIGKEDVNQDVLDNMCDILMIELQTHRKYERVSLVKTEGNIKLFQMRDYGTNAEAKIQNSVSTLRRKVIEKILHVDISYIHMDTVYSHYKTNVQKCECVLQRWFSTER